MRKKLYKPIQIVLSGGRTFEGLCSKFSDNGFTLKRYQDGGEIELYIKANEIVSINFPGREAEQHLVQLINNKKLKETLELYKLLYIQRRAFFQYLPERSIHFFLIYIKIALDEGDEALAIAVAENLAPHVKTPHAIEYLQDLMLLAQVFVRVWNRVSGWWFLF